MKSVFANAPVLALLQMVFCQVQGQGFQYAVNNGSITITSYTGSGGNVNIPSTINGLPVTGIGDFAFATSTTLTSVTIANGVTTIGYQAFLGCHSLTNVALPNTLTNIGGMAFQFCTSLTDVVIPTAVMNLGLQAFCCCFSLTNVALPDGLFSVGDSAFYRCTNLTSIMIPMNVTNIGFGAFDGCVSLARIEVDALNPAFSSVDGVLFNKALTQLIRYPPAKSGNYWVPNSVTYIVPDAFDSYGGLTGVLAPRLGAPNGFGFSISWGTNTVAVVESSTNVTAPIWSPVSTNTLFNGKAYFNDPAWTNYPARFYRLRRL